MYQLEMHLHTLNQSPCAETDEKTIAALYAEHGYHGIVCTNHYASWLCENYYKKPTPRENAEFYLQGFETLKQVCGKFGIDVFLGMELLIDALTYYKETPPKAELLIYGITPEWLLSHPYDLFAMSLEEVSALCKQHNWMLGQSHPFRSFITLQDPAYLEAAEVYNGHPQHDSHNDKALGFAERNGLIYTAGSDFHAPDSIGSGVLLQQSVSTNEELLAELRKRRHTVLRRTES